MIMKNMATNRHSTQRGFSMIELVVVLGMIMVLSAIGLPRLVNSITVFKLNAASTSLQNLIEQARFNAVRRNTTISLRQTLINGQAAFYVDLPNTSVYVNTDPTYVVPTTVQIAPAAAPAAGTTGLANTAALGGGCISFNSRGVVDYTNCGGGVQSVWFISLGMTNGTGGYRAITLTPMGQAKSWTAPAGGTWGTM
jgi:prepilin-type N-terminal cleavage/methylation domain-containing protein